MKEYKVEVTETLTHLVKVSANDEESAYEIAKQMYHDEDIILDYNDLSSVDFSVLKS